MLVWEFFVCREVYIFFSSNFMESCRDMESRLLTYYTGIMNGDIEIDSQLLGTSQNTPMSVSDSPSQVENALLQKKNGALTLV